MAEQALDISAVDNLVNNPSPQPTQKKHDWFKGDLAGLNNNMADLHTQGLIPEDYGIHPQSKYWGDPAIRKPFEEKFGPDAETKFKEVYDASSRRLQEYTNIRNDLSGTSKHLYIAPGKIERNLVQLGYGDFDRSQPREVDNNIRDPWGAEMVYRTRSHAVFTPPRHSIRQGAEKNGVMAPDGNLVSLDEYLERNPGVNLVYATNKEGAPELKNGLNYLRPLEYGEERQPFEEIYGGKLNTYFGMNGIDRPEGYWWKFTGKNLMNFTADSLDAGAEFLKVFDNLWQNGDQSAWDKSMTEFQNDVQSIGFVPTSEEGKSTWTSTESLVDGISQVAGQVVSMIGIARGVTALGTLAKLGANSSARLGSTAGRVWMASLVSDDFVKEARRMGFSPKEQQAMYGLYMLGMYHLAGLSELAVDPVKAKLAESAVIKSMLGQMKEVAQKSGGKLTPTGMWQGVKNGYGSLKNGIVNGLGSESAVVKYAASGATESVEEVSELFFDKAFKEAVNNLYNPIANAYSGDTRRDVRFNVNWEDLPTELAQSATLGFFGGMLARRIINPKALDMKTLLSYGGVEGGYKKLNRMLDKLYADGQLVPGGKKIDVMGKEITDGHVDQSREYLVYKALKNEVAGAEALWKSMGLTQAFANTESALKFVTDSSLVKQTSIGNDIAERLTEMTELNNKINTAEITDNDAVKKATTRLEELKNELEDIKAGRYAGKYLAEGIYNLYVTQLRDKKNPTGVAMSTFDRYDKLDKSLAARVDLINKMGEIDKMPLEEVLSTKPSISKEQADKLSAKLLEKYKLSYEQADEEGEPELVGDPDNITKYHQEMADVNQLIHADPPNAMFEFLRTPNVDGTPGEQFSKILENESKLAQDKTNVYDDVENVERIRTSIFERLSQIEGIIAVNRTFNVASETGNLGESRPDVDNKDLAAAEMLLRIDLGFANQLLTVAKENRKSFFQASLKAWAGQTQVLGAKLLRTQELLAGRPEFSELYEKLSPLTIAIANEEDPDQRMKNIFEAEQLIHDTFAADKKSAIDRFWNIMDLDDSFTVFNQYKHNGDFVYLKSLINLNPREFRDAYFTALSQAEENKFTPFPEQYGAVFIATASLMGGYNPLTNFPAPKEGAESMQDMALTETIFINGHQGVGKTFITALSLRTAQIMRGGSDKYGVVAVIAKQGDLRYKNYVALGQMKVGRNDSIRKTMNGQELLDFLNSEQSNETTLIYIDETTMYSRDELYKIDQRVREINSTVTDPNKTIKILMTGDTHQATVMTSDGKRANSIDNQILVDRTPRLGFSFRTGNQDIVGFLKHLSNIFDTLQSSVRPPVVSFNYNSKELSGVNVTDEIDKVIADIMKRKEINSKELVVIATPERLAEIRKKHEKSLGDSQLLTPMQAQGLQWKYVIVDLPFSTDGPTEEVMRQLRDVISAVGRSQQMVVINNQPAIGVISGSGESPIIAATFSPEELTILKERHAKLLSESGSSSIEVQTSPVNRPLVKAERHEEVLIYNQELSQEMRDKIMKMMLSIKPRSGEKIKADMIFTTLAKYGPDGKIEVISDPATLQIWKKQLFYPGMFQETDFDVNDTIFEIRLESSGLPTGLLNKPTDKPLTGKPNLIIYANLMKDGEKIAEMQVLSINAFEETALPNAKMTMSLEDSRIFLSTLHENLPDAEKETKNQFKEEHDLRDKGAKVNKHSVIDLDEFKKRNKFFQYATHVWHTVGGSTGQGGKVPYLFFSPSLSEADINNVLATKQIGVEILEETASSRREIMQASLSDLASKRVFAIALDGGNIVDVDTFLARLHEDLVTGKKFSDKHRLKDAPVHLLVSAIVDTFNIKVTKKSGDGEAAIGAAAKEQLTKMDIKKMSKMKKYLRKKVIEYIKPVYKKNTTKVEPKITGPNTVEIQGVNSPKEKKGPKKLGLRYNEMLEAIYRDSISNGDDTKVADEVIAWLKKDIFKYGIFNTTKTQANSTDPHKTAFGQIDIQDEVEAEYSVSNLLMPSMPVFFLDENLLKNIMKKGSLQGYNVDVKVTYKTPEPATEVDAFVDKMKSGAVLSSPEDVQFYENNKTVIEAKLKLTTATRVPVESTKSDEGYTKIDTSAGNTSSVSTLLGLTSAHFSKDYDSLWLEEFVNHFRKTVVYDNLFSLHTNTPHIVSQLGLHKTISQVKNELKQKADKIKAMGMTPEQRLTLLRSNDYDKRKLYYDYVIAHEFDFLLKEYFPGISVKSGQYRYTTRDYKQGPVPDENDVSHLDVGNDLVKFHLFSMPIFTESNMTFYRMPSKEDYYRLIRMVRDNDITSTQKAIAFFKVDQIRTSEDLLKQSFYMRFLSPAANQIGGKAYHSIMSAAGTDPLTQEISNSHVTGLLGFLSTGTESQYTRSVFDYDFNSVMSGRNVDIDPSRYRQNLEDGIRAIHKVIHVDKATSNVNATYSEKSKDQDEQVSIKFVKRDGSSTAWYIRKKGGDVYINKKDGSAVDVSDMGAFFKAIGLGEINKRFYGRIFKSDGKTNVSMLSSIFSIARYLSQENTERPIFAGGLLNDWITASSMMSDFKQIEGAYGRMTLDGNYQELVTIGYPYVRTNQKIKELRNRPSILQKNAAVTGEMDFTAFLIKDGFEMKDGSRKRANSKMTASEQLFYDFNELYLGSLSRHKSTDLKQRAIFNPITFSDKGRDGVSQVEANFLPKIRGEKVDIEFIRSRAINDITNYYRGISVGIINTWYSALKSSLPLVNDTTSSEELMFKMNEINALISNMTPEQRRDLVKTDLVSELMYTPERMDILDTDGQTRNYYVVGNIKQPFIDNVDVANVRRNMESNYNKFKISFDNRSESFLKRGSQREAMDKLLSDTGMTMQEARDSFFWNSAWVTNTFNSLWLGPQEQYKSTQEYYDMVKRASQISTNRARVITRSEDWAPGQSVYEGRKMGRYSNTAILRDFTTIIPTISGGNVKNQKLFDGSSFFNIYGKLQMQYSYGNDAGFNVGANIKPIGTYMNPSNGSVRYDKYASFEITAQMIETGHPFIRRINELMMKSVTFPGDGVNEGIMVSDGNIVMNLFELDAWGKSHGLNEAQIYDYMVSKGVQDYFIREVTFDSSVKSGVSNINDFGNDMNNPLFYDENTVLKTVKRDNAEWGLILDASKESNDSDARLAGQFVSTFLQSVHTQEEAIDIMKAIQKIGDVFRETFDPLDRDKYMKVMREALASRDEIGLMGQLVNMAGKDIPLSNRAFMKSLHSALASWISDETIRFRIFGGQQVIAPATGVWRVIDDALGTRIAASGEIISYNGVQVRDRELKGFNATRETNGQKESILTHPIWIQLNAAVAAKNNLVANQLRAQLREELISGGWEVEVPEVIISPTHFRAFGIPEGTNIENVTEELFMAIDMEKAHSRFNPNMTDEEGDFIMSDADRLNYTTAVEGNAASPEQLKAMRQPYIDAIAKERAADGKYTQQLEDFKKTLNIIMGRIPATFFQSLAPLKVVGFAHGADNTSYVHPDILVLQGADHDIDKGNIMSFEPDSKGRVVVPESLEEAGDNPIYLKNFIVKRMMDGLNKPAVLIESTLPTNTANIDETIQRMGLSVDKSENLYNPISNNDSYVRGQGGKSNISIHASGLKTFSSIFHSAIQRGESYSNYTPQSMSLFRGGRPFELSGIDGGVSGLIMFGEAIQASVDNAKDPKLGLLGWDRINGGIVNALAMFGYNPQEITSFLTHPEIQSVYNEYRSSKEFYATKTDFFKSVKKIISTRTATPEMKDLSFLVDASQKMLNLTFAIGINREVPNDMFTSVRMLNAFKSISGGMTMFDYVRLSEEQREELAENWAMNAALSFDKTLKINPFQIFNDNFHILSYMTSFDKLERVMSSSKMYLKIMDGASHLNFFNEEQYSVYEDMMYGLAVDAYFASKPDGRHITLNGKSYDMTLVTRTESSQTRSRLDFMRDFPNYFMKLPQSSQDTISSMLQTRLQGETPILKLEGSYRDYSTEKKVKAKMLFQTMTTDLKPPAGDSNLATLFFYYSLIKDKGGLGANSLVDLFDYTNSEYIEFDRYVNDKFDTPYLRNPEELRKLYVNFSGGYGKLRDEGLAALMRSNRSFIPYTNDITVNDAIQANPTEAKDTKPDTSGRIGFRYGESQSRLYIDDETKKALAYPVNRRMLERLSDQLSAKYGIQAEVIDGDEFASLFGQNYRTVKGTVRSGKVYINSDIATIDTPVHEFTHLWLEALAVADPDLHARIESESLNHPYADRIREIYPELDDKGIAGEVFATLTGIYNSGRASSTVNRDFFDRVGQMFKDFSNWLNNLFLDIFGMKPSVNDSLLSIIDKVGESMLSTSAFAMSPYDKQVLRVLGVRTETADDTLSAVRDRLKYQNRFEKICV